MAGQLNYQRQKRNTFNTIDQTISKHSSKDNMGPKFTAYKKHTRKEISHLKTKNVILTLYF